MLSLPSAFYHVEIAAVGPRAERFGTDAIYGIAAEFANSGFAKIRELIPDFDEYDEDDFVQQLIALMDEKYDQIFPQ